MPDQTIEQLGFGLLSEIAPRQATALPYVAAGFYGDPALRKEIVTAVCRPRGPEPEAVVRTVLVLLNGLATGGLRAAPDRWLGLPLRPAVPPPAVLAAAAPPGRRPAYHVAGHPTRRIGMWGRRRLCVPATSGPATAVRARPPAAAAEAAATAFDIALGASLDVATAIQIRELLADGLSASR